MLVIEGTCHVVHANAAIAAQLGYETQALVGMPIERLIPIEFPNIDASNRDCFAKAFTTRIGNHDLQIYAQKQNGEPLQAKAALGKMAATQENMSVLSLTDQTELNAERRHFHRLQKNLEARNHEMSRFAYNASHDLKAPVASIMGLLSFCIEDLDDGVYAELRENLQTAQTLCEDSSSRINAIFEVTQAGEIDFPTEEIRLESLIRSIWHGRADREDGRLELLLDLRHDCRVFAERPTLMLILENLLSNTIRFRDTDKPGLTVKVRSRHADGILHIAVADNGVGIPASRHRDVFKMFRHINERSANGLGLALIKRHIERLGGTIGFTSTEHEGSEFSIALPLCTDAMR